MTKIMGMSENTHMGVGGLFLGLFLLSLLSASLYFSDGDWTTGAQVLGVCGVTGLLPAVIFFYIGMQLRRQRLELQHLAHFLHSKQRATIPDVVQQYQWSERDAEDRIVAAISEGHVQGHFDRGTRTFYISGAQAQMTFVEKCSSCGAVMGVWVSPAQPAFCEFCGTPHPTPGAVPPPPHHLAQQMAPPPAAAAAAAPYQQPPGAPQTMAAPPQGQAYPPPPPGQAYPQQQPPPQAYYPPRQAAAQPPQAPSPTGYDHTVQKRKRSVRFLFLSASPNGMIIGAVVVLFFASAFLAAGFFAGRSTFGDTNTTYSTFTMLSCTSVFWAPLFGLGAWMITKSIRMDKYLDELEEVADYIVTFRKIEVHILARKMNMPEQQVRKLIEDIQKYKLVEGQYTADWSTFAVRIRTEDQQFVRDCPYCKAPGINVQVIRGGAERCGYCDSVIFFQERVVE